jgi:predicted aspartyl protease
MKMRLLFALALVCIAAPAGAEESCVLKQAAKLDMTPIADGRFTIPMSVGGQTFPMLVDTGGLISMLTPQTVDVLQLHPAPFFNLNIRITQYGGYRIDHHVTAPDVAIGTMRAPRYDFLIMPAGGYPSDIGGLLAPDIMRAYDMDFDFANATLNFFYKDHCEGKVVYWTQGDIGEVQIRLDEVGHMTVPVTLDGKEIRATIDTGAANSVASLEEVESLFGLDEKSPDLKPLGRPDRPVYRYPFKSLSFQSVSVSYPDIVLIPDRESKVGASGPKMLLGMNVLRHLHLYIAYGEHKLYVTPATAH